MRALLDRLTAEEMFSLKQHRVFLGLLLLLLKEINRRRGFDAALFADVQARTDALAASLNEIRTLLTPALEVTVLPAMTTTPPALLTITQITASIKENIA